MQMMLQGRIVSTFLMFSLVILSGCGDHPEQTIVGEWVEIKAVYENYTDIEDDEYDHRKVTRHETEQWIFEPDNSFTIKRPHQEPVTGKWRMSGRGHILKLLYDGENSNDEVYDIKELNNKEMIINVDIDMEIRGIANFTFRRKVPSVPET